MSAQSAEHATALGEMTAKATAAANERDASVQELRHVKEALEKQGAEHEAVIAAAATKVSEANGQLEQMQKELDVIKSAQAADEAEKAKSAGKVERLSTELKAAQALAQTAESSQKYKVELEGKIERLQGEMKQMEEQVELAQREKEEARAQMQVQEDKAEKERMEREKEVVGVEGVKKERDGLRAELEGLASVSVKSYQPHLILGHSHRIKLLLEPNYQSSSMVVGLRGMNAPTADAYRRHPSPLFPTARVHRRAQFTAVIASREFPS